MFKGIAAGVAVAALGSALAFGSPANAQGRPHFVSWSGTVDDTAEVHIHGDDVRTENISGRGVWHVDSHMEGRLPDDHPVTVFIRDFDGRGRVRVVQQPRPENGFTAIVLIRDPRSGAGRYHFDLGWQAVFGHRDRDRDRDRDHDRDDFYR